MFGHHLADVGCVGVDVIMETGAEGGGRGTVVAHRVLPVHENVLP